MESQEPLINLIQAAVAQITDARKSLKGLGTAPVAADVQAILMRVSWLGRAAGSLLFFLNLGVADLLPRLLVSWMLTRSMCALPQV